MRAAAACNSQLGNVAKRALAQRRQALRTGFLRQHVEGKRARSNAQFGGTTNLVVVRSRGAGLSITRSKGGSQRCVLNFVNLCSLLITTRKMIVAFEPGGPGCFGLI